MRPAPGFPGYPRFVHPDDIKLPAFAVDTPEPHLSSVKREQVVERSDKWSLACCGQVISSGPPWSTPGTSLYIDDLTPSHGLLGAPPSCMERKRVGVSLSRVSLVTPRFVPADALEPSMAYFGLCKAAWKVPKWKRTGLPPSLWFLQECPSGALPLARLWPPGRLQVLPCRNSGLWPPWLPCTCPSKWKMSSVLWAPRNCT